MPLKNRDLRVKKDVSDLKLETIKPFRLGDLLRSFPSLTASQAIGLLAGGAIFVVAAIGLVVLFFLLFPDCKILFEASMRIFGA